MKEFRNKVTILSFVLAILIVLRHSSGIGIYQLPNWLYFIESLIAQGTDVVVPVFFAISGFLFFTNLEWKDFPRKFKTRFRSLFIPYVVWNTIGFLLVLAICHIPQIAGRVSTTMPPTEPLPLLKSIFWETKYNITWFIKDLMIYIIFSPLYKLLNINKLLGVGVLIMLLFLGYYFDNSIILYSTAFYFGAFFAEYYNSQVQMRYQKGLILGSSILLVVSIIAQTALVAPQGASVIWLRLIQIPLVWICADLLATKEEPQWWLRTSFLIYVAHHIVLEPLEKCIFFVLGNNSLGALVDIVFAPTITIILILSMSKLVNTKMPRFYSFINGGRA